MSSKYIWTIQIQLERFGSKRARRSFPQACCQLIKLCDLVRSIVQKKHRPYLFVESSMMKGFLACVLGLAAFASAIPSEYEDDPIFRRAVNDQCKAPGGTGACQKTANCPGISYPTGLCPRDPKDVQVGICHPFISNLR